MVRQDVGRPVTVTLNGLGWAAALRMMGAPWWAVLLLAFLQTVFPQESADKVTVLREALKTSRQTPP